MSIREVFNKSARSYDSSRRELIPCFDDFYGTALELLPFSSSDSFNVLDLGAGTGLFSAMVSELYPKAQITLYDLSDKMLDIAKERFSGNNNIRFFLKDYSKEDFDGKYQVIISALSIHHLEDTDKEELFKTICNFLEDGGVFINADQALGETEEIEKTYREMWLKQVKERGVSKKELDASLERLKEDKMATLSKQLKWLERAGFSRINCWYQNYSFIVYSGTKR